VNHLCIEIITIATDVFVPKPLSEALWPGKVILCASNVASGNLNPPWSAQRSLAVILGN